jgi:MFS family permease
MMRPLVGTYVLELGGTEVDASIALAAFSVIPTVLAVLVGGVVDGWGTRPILIAGGSLMITGGGLMLIPNLTTVIVSQVVLGLGTLCVWVSLQTSVTMSTGPQESRDARASRIATFSLFVSIGQAVGPLLSGTLQSTAGYPTAIATYAGLSMLLFVFAIAIAPSRARVAQSERRRMPVLGAYADAAKLLRRRTVVIAVLVSFTALLLHDIRSAWQPVLLHNAGVDQWQIGLVLSVSALAGFCARPFFALLLRVLRAPLFVGLVLVLGASTAMLVIAAPQNLPFLLSIGALNGLAVGFAQPLSLTLLSDDVPSDRLGVASGLRSTGNQSALVISPIAFGTVSAFATLSAAFIVVGGAAALAGVLSALLLAFHRSRREPEVEVATADGLDELVAESRVGAAERGSR